MIQRQGIISLMMLFLLLSFGSGKDCCVAQDFARMGEQSLTGTARYVGMGGAMAAIGGDPSAANDNVAGLGLYRRSEVLVTLDYSYDKTHQPDNPLVSQRHLVNVPQVSWVFSLPTYKSGDEGVQFNTFMLSYHRLHSYGRTLYGVGASGRSLGALLGTLDVQWDIPFEKNRTNKTNDLLLREAGYVHRFAIDWAMNISNRWYAGAGLHVNSYNLSSDGDYQETFGARNAAGAEIYNRNTTTLLMTGVGVDFSFGLLYRPTGWLRLGFGLTTPSLGSLTVYSTGTLRAQTDSLRASSAPNMTGSVSGFHRPLRLSTSAAFQIGAYGILALQYDYSRTADRPDLHTLKAGLEVIPVLGMYINAGYVYESMFSRNVFPAVTDTYFERQDTYSLYPKTTQYASVAFGYRGTYFMVQAAYQYRWQRLNMWAHENAQPYDMRGDTHRIVLTFGWHRP